MPFWNILNNWNRLINIFGFSSYTICRTWFCPLYYAWSLKPLVNGPHDNIASCTSHFLLFQNCVDFNKDLIDKSVIVCAHADKHANPIHLPHIRNMVFIRIHYSKHACLMLKLRNKYLPFSKVVKCQCTLMSHNYG